eukprot:jgi/Undpi1/10914/HiC_scaffold_3.g01440.m1
MLYSEEDMEIRGFKLRVKVWEGAIMEAVAEKLVIAMLLLLEGGSHKRTRACKEDESREGSSAEAGEAKDTIVSTSKEDRVQPWPGAASTTTTKSSQEKRRNTTVSAEEVYVPPRLKFHQPVPSLPPTEGSIASTESEKSVEMALLLRGEPGSAQQGSCEEGNSLTFASGQALTMSLVDTEKPAPPAEGGIMASFARKSSKEIVSLANGKPGASKNVSEGNGVKVSFEQARIPPLLHDVAGRVVPGQSDWSTQPPEGNNATVSPRNEPMPPPSDVMRGKRVSAELGSFLDDQGRGRGGEGGKGGQEAKEDEEEEGGGGGGGDGGESEDEGGWEDEVDDDECPTRLAMMHLNETPRQSENGNGGYVDGDYHGEGAGERRGGAGGCGAVEAAVRAWEVVGVNMKVRVEVEEEVGVGVGVGCGGVGSGTNVGWGYREEDEEDGMNHS